MHTAVSPEPRPRLTTRKFIIMTVCCGLFLAIAAWSFNSSHQTQLLLEEHEPVILGHVRIEGRGRRVDIAYGPMLADWSTGIAQSAKGMFHTEKRPSSGRYLVHLWYGMGGRHVFFAEFYEDEFLVEASIELDDPVELAIETRHISLTPRSEADFRRIFRYLNSKDGSVRGSELRLNEDGTFTESYDPSLL